MGVYDENGFDSSENQVSVENLEGEFRNLSIDTNESDQRGGFPYPQRSGQPDCAFFMKTGTCKYGMSCRFNHPPNRRRNKGRPSLDSSEAVSEREKEELPERAGQQECKCFAVFMKNGTWKYGMSCGFNHPPNSRRNQGRPSLDSSEPVSEREKEELPERAGQPECKFYIKTGNCKFGKACRFHHPREKNGTEEQLELNFLELPIRPGERECPFYMRTGACKFATSCRFHHPEPIAMGGSDPVPGYLSGGSLPLHSPGISIPPMASWSMQRGTNELGLSHDPSPSYAPVMLAPHQGVMPNTGWNGYQAPINPMLPPEWNQQLPPTAPINNPAKIPDHASNQQQMPPLEEFPERPGQLECKYFMKNGDCKYKSACRFHHPKTRVSKLPVSLNPFGLPLRPDQAICTHYSRYGICKFGAACNFDHPVNHGYPPSFPVATPSARQ